MAGMTYTKLESKFPDDDDTGYSPTMPHHHCPNFFTWPWFIAAVAFSVGILAAFGGMRLLGDIRKRDTDWLRPPGNVKVQFEYNDTFPGPPTIESEYAWLDLLPGKKASMPIDEEMLTIPDGLGAVQHDELSDAIVTLSVFHQLHCLMVLRHAVYDNWNGTRHSHMTPHHSRHCLEYLRQSIMCNVDTNVEYRVVREDGVKNTPGWDVKRCRNFYAARKWAEEWRAFDGKIPSEKQEITDPDILRGRVIDY